MPESVRSDRLKNTYFLRMTPVRIFCSFYKTSFLEDKLQQPSSWAWQIEIYEDDAAHNNMNVGQETSLFNEQTTAEEGDPAHVVDVKYLLPGLVLKHNMSLTGKTYHVLKQKWIWIYTERRTTKRFWKPMKRTLTLYFGFNRWFITG